MIKIIDSIKTTSIYGTNLYVVVDKMPDFLFERKTEPDGRFLVGENSGFFIFYKYGEPSRHFQAFGGRKFDIPLLDGGVVKASGEWWDSTPDSYHGMLYSIGIGTPSELGSCNVYTAIHADAMMIDEFIAKNELSNNYNKYDKRHSDYGKHIISTQAGAE